MNETPNDSDKLAKEAKATRTSRYLRMVAILFLVVYILLVLYNWRNNNNSLSDILSSFGLIFLILGMIVGEEKKVPYYILLVVGMILLLSALGRLIFS
jgi:hypothetical protein